MPSKKRETPISLQPLDALFGTNEETNNGICEIAIGSLHPFPNHPFQVKDDKKMEELSESITQYGVLVPGIVRLRGSGGYELVAGHTMKWRMKKDFIRLPSLFWQSEEIIPMKSVLFR